MVKKYLLLLALFSSPLFAQEQLVLNGETEFAPSFSNRFSFAMALNPSLTKSSDITNFTFSYGKQMDDFWLDATVSLTNGTFRELSANNPTATGATDDQLAEQKNGLLCAGFGIARETRYAQTLLPFEGIHELMAANVTYNSYKEDFSGNSFSGPGLMAKFSLYKKFNDYFSAGGHFNYNIAVVERSENSEDETTSQRSLTLGFVTVGIDLSFYL